MTFSASAQTNDTPEVREYNRIKRRLTIADLLINVVFLVVLLATGWSATLRDWAYGAAGQSYSLAVFFYVAMLLVISKALGFGLDYYSFRLEHQFNLSNQKLKSWLWDETKGWLVGLVIATILVEMIYNVIRLEPGVWWLIVWVVYNALAIFFAQIAPVVLFPLFYKFTPLENDELSKRLIKLSEKAGTRVRGVYEWKLSEKSKKANAALAGLGATRRIILADTLIENYTSDEIEAVLAHELGHHVHKHILKSIALQIGVSLIGFWVVAQALNFAVEKEFFPMLHDFASVPLLVLLTTVMSFLLMPIMNAYSRQKEREADRYSLESIPAVGPFISSMNKLADQNLAERNPSRFVEIWFHSHPPIGKRIAAAQDFQSSVANPNS
ncbi:MAG TPA: M48 family metallopeptidase [Terriglobales bacterium]|nr:M48 family metallopeptidase [Terriglobales bacterium]